VTAIQSLFALRHADDRSRATFAPSPTQFSEAPLFTLRIGQPEFQCQRGIGLKNERGRLAFGLCDTEPGFCVTFTLRLVIGAFLQESFE